VVTAESAHRISLDILPVLLALAGLGGCVTRDPYPDYWPPLAVASDPGCPDLAGRYRVEAIETGTCYAGGDRAYKAEWRCRFELDWALGVDGAAPSDGWIQLSQPDPDRLMVTTEHGTRVLRRTAGDFRCERGVLEIVEHASALSEQGESKTYNALMGASVGLAYASGGVNTLSRRFRRAADGSLVAELYESSTGLILLVPYHRSERHYLRWATWEAPAPEGGDRRDPAGDIP